MEEVQRKGKQRCPESLQNLWKQDSLASAQPGVRSALGLNSLSRRWSCKEHPCFLLSRWDVPRHLQSPADSSAFWSQASVVRTVPGQARTCRHGECGPHSWAFLLPFPLSHALCRSVHHTPEMSTPGKDWGYPGADENSCSGQDVTTASAVFVPGTIHREALLGRSVGR